MSFSDMLQCLCVTWLLTGIAAILMENELTKRVRKLGEKPGSTILENFFLLLIGPLGLFITLIFYSDRSQKISEREHKKYEEDMIRNQLQRNQSNLEEKISRWEKEGKVVLKIRGWGGWFTSNEVPFLVPSHLIFNVEVRKEDVTADYKVILKIRCIEVSQFGAYFELITDEKKLSISQKEDLSIPGRIASAKRPSPSEFEMFGVSSKISLGDIFLMEFWVDVRSEKLVGDTVYLSGFLEGITYPVVTDFFKDNDGKYDQRLCWYDLYYVADPLASK